MALAVVRVGNWASVIFCKCHLMQIVVLLCLCLKRLKVCRDFSSFSLHVVTRILWLFLKKDTFSLGERLVLDNLGLMILENYPETMKQSHTNHILQELQLQLTKRQQLYHVAKLTLSALLNQAICIALELMVVGNLVNLPMILKRSAVVLTKK